MRYEWDENKSRLNHVKHGVSFETARLVFEDPLHLSFSERVEDGEERWQTLGLVQNVVLLLVVHTMCQEPNEEVIRLVSARKATKRERRFYEQGN